MSTIVGEFTVPGVSSLARLTEPGQGLVVSLTGSFAATVQLERENGSPGSGAFQIVGGPWTEPAEFTYVARQPFEVLRLRCPSHTSGTASYTLALQDKQLGVERHGYSRILRGVQRMSGKAQHGMFDFEGGKAPTRVIIPESTTAEREVHAGRTCVTLGGRSITITLPPATGSGDVYNWYTDQEIEGPDTLTFATTGSDVFKGRAEILSPTAVSAFAAAAGNNRITLNGGTRGGKELTRVTNVDVAPGIYYTEISTGGEGTLATPFSTV